MHSQSPPGQVGGALGGDNPLLPSCPPLMADAGALGGHSVSSVSGLGSHQAAHPVQGHKPGTEEGWVICQDPHALLSVWVLESATLGSSSGL